MVDIKNLNIFIQYLFQIQYLTHAICRSIEGNQFSGPIPREIGKLINLQKL